MRYPADIRGVRFGKWVALAQAKPSLAGKTQWTCVCDCGTQRVVRRNLLVSRTSQSCGCSRKRHGMTGSRIWKVWEGMIERFDRKKSISYKYYGGRGIGVCSRWRLFENFFEDMGQAPSGKSLDRLDNSKGYSKDNCRWATARDQMRNRRDSIYLSYRGRRLHLNEWSEITGIKKVTLDARLRNGWSVERTLETPPQRRSK